MFVSVCGCALLTACVDVVLERVMLMFVCMCDGAPLCVLCVFGHVFVT